MFLKRLFSRSAPTAGWLAVFAFGWSLVIIFVSFNLGVQFGVRNFEPIGNFADSVDTSDRFDKIDSKILNIEEKIALATANNQYQNGTSSAGLSSDILLDKLNRSRSDQEQRDKIDQINMQILGMQIQNNTNQARNGLSKK